jgi:hypothetical protein
VKIPCSLVAESLPLSLRATTVKKYSMFRSRCLTCKLDASRTTYESRVAAGAPNSAKSTRYMTDVAPVALSRQKYAHDYIVSKQGVGANIPIWPVPTRGSQLRVALVGCKSLMRSPTTICGAAGKVVILCDAMLGETP